MNEKFQHWNQYGYHVDVFDKYREAVRRSNRSAVQVFSVLAVFASLTITAFGLIIGQPPMGAVFCVLLLAAGILGIVISFRKKCSRDVLLIAGYLLSAAVYALSIYGTYSFRTDVFWIGTQLAVACYLYDYAWRACALQVAGYAALRFVWNSAGITMEPMTRAAGISASVAASRTYPAL